MIGNEAVAQKSKTWKQVNTYQQCPQLGDLLNAWISAVERYTSQFPDNPWSYNERAILSTLAGAAWTMDGWVAMEEFATSKRLRKLEPGVDHGDKLRNGRCDLFVSSPEASFVFEAKQANQPTSRSGHDPMVTHTPTKRWALLGKILVMCRSERQITALRQLLWFP